MPRFLLVALLGALLAAPARATIVFEQPHAGTGTLHKSSWYPPDGLDGDNYCWDRFTLAGNTAISEVHWRGGYEYHASGSGQSPVFDFEVSIYRSSVGGSQPDLGAGGRLARYFVGSNAGETSAGAFGGVTFYDYAFTLPSPFQATGGTPYWVRIVASQGIAPPFYAPDWGLAVGTGGNNSHFRYITGGTYQNITNDLAFSLHASSAPTVTIAAAEFPTGAGLVTGAGAYPIGSQVSLTAAANPGWGFLNWTEGASPVSTNPNYTFAATTNRTLVANFDTAFTVTTSVYPDYGGTVTGAGVYTVGSTVTLEALPAHGFVFNSWSDGMITPLHVFPAASDIQLTAFFDSAPNAATFDFNNAPVHTPLPLDQTVSGLGAHFTGGYSVQAVGTVGIAPAGFSGNYLYPGSVFGSDLEINFSESLIDFSILYATQELNCDGAARVRVTAYLDGLFVGTNTMVAPLPGAYPSATLSITPPGDFNRVVVHWDAPGVGCQDYGVILFLDNVTVTRAVAPGAVDEGNPAVAPRLAAPAPNPFQRSTTIRFDLPKAGEVRLNVFDMQGRLVRSLVSGAMEAGPVTLTWDGTDNGGRPVSAGLYALSLDAAGTRQTRRILRLR